jgi:hypothetical protein
VGTQGGLDRFNGYEFKQYEHESSDTTSIIDGPSWWLKKVKLWIKEVVL